MFDTQTASDAPMVDELVVDPWWVEDHDRILELTREAWAGDDAEYEGYAGIPG